MLTALVLACFLFAAAIALKTLWYWATLGGRFTVTYMRDGASLYTCHACGDSFIGGRDTFARMLRHDVRHN